MNRLRIGGRLALGFGLVLLCTAVLMTVALWRMNAAAQATQEITGQYLESERLISRWMGFIRENTLRTQALAKVNDAGLRDEFQAAMKETTQEGVQVQARLKEILPDQMARDLFEDVQQRRNDYRNARAAAIEAQNFGDFDKAQKFFSTDMNRLLEAYDRSIANLLGYQQRLITLRTYTLEQNNQRAFWMVLGVGVASLLLGFLFAFGITRSITKPLRRAVDIAKAVSNRDLTRHIDVSGRDETSELLGALRQMNTNLLGIIGQVQEGAGSIATASNQIAAGNTDLSSRTEEQASSLAETAATMEQLTTTVRQNADNARKANQLAGSAAQVADGSGQVVSRVVDTMTRIDAQARQMAEIISVIDGIAFQTNILALNAAVEAARAGEQGRGFAVVAGEVRALAQRSATAAHEVKALIEGAVQASQEGNGLVEEAGRTMHDTVQSIRRVVDIMEEITSASAEQSIGIDQVNQAISQMDQVTQQNAALVEEAAVASQSMREQADALAGLADTFRLSSAGEAPALGHSRQVLLAA